MFAEPRPWTAWGFCMVFCSIIGSLVLIKSLSNLWTGFRSESWPYTTGTIVSTKLIRKHIDAIYTYDVDGTQRTGHLIWVCPCGDDEENAQAFAKYRPGVTTNVYYDPDKPTEAVLEPGWNRGMKNGVWFGSAFFCFGLLSGWVWWGKRASRGNRPLLGD